ncbi:MAG TPA: hypothetical protein VFE47_13340 [Tepidisphaeraceae bacterium]|jgi:hypothetical protein|nr:hypothetical protein [Tepidisphaeraceae bacterium]
MENLTPQAAQMVDQLMNVFKAGQDRATDVSDDDILAAPGQPPEGKT